MRIVAIVHGYPPIHMAGAEMALHSVLRHLVEHDWQADVVATRTAYARKGVVDGVRVHVEPDNVDELCAAADVIVTHLDETRQAIRYADKHDKPLVHYLHNTMQLDYHRVSNAECHLAVCCSDWVRSTLPDGFNAVTVNPPIVDDDYRVSRTGKRITLVNMTEAKGGRVFRALVERNPQWLFLGVEGSYGKQETMPKAKNLKMLDNTDDMRQVYRDTHIVLMPSSYESWGRVAQEAMLNGIPVIAHPTPGLVENLGDAGVFCDRDDVTAWEAAIRNVERQYDMHAAVARERYTECQTQQTKQLEVFRRALTTMLEDFYRLELDNTTKRFLRRALTAKTTDGVTVLIDRNDFINVYKARGWTPT